MLFASCTGIETLGLLNKKWVTENALIFVKHSVIPGGRMHYKCVVLLAEFIYVLWRHCLLESDCCKAEFTVLPRATTGLGTIMLHFAQVGWHCLGSRWPAPFNHQVYHHCWSCQEHACAVEVPCIRYVGVLKLCDCLNISTSPLYGEV